MTKPKEKRDYPIEIVLSLLDDAVGSYITLMYFQAFFMGHLRQKDRTCTYDKNFIILSTPERYPEHFTLEHSSIVNQINAVGGMDNLALRNARFMRNKAINSFYEIIHKYLTNEGLSEFQKYHGYDWFRVLYVLRNSASHEDSGHNPIGFPDKNNRYKDKPHLNPAQPYPETIKWGTIEIKRGQTTPIKYSDKDLLDLFMHVIKFFQKENDLSKKT